MTIETGAEIGLGTLSQLLDLPDHGIAPGGEEASYADALARFEVSYLRELLQKFDGNVEEAARAAGMNMATIYRKLKKYQLKKSDVM